MFQCFAFHIQQVHYLVNKSNSDFPRNILHEINDIVSHERNYNKDMKQVCIFNTKIMIACKIL